MSHTSSKSSAAFTISAVLPTWCEAGRIVGAVRRAKQIADEVIVVDGGSPDGTADLARRAGARVVRAAKGRGSQLRAGADAAKGNVLLFLHADAALGGTARQAMEGALRDAKCAGGNFRLRFVPDEKWVCQLFSQANHLRRLWFRVYYGDSGIFVRREVYDALGGFRDYPVFEDYDFVQRLERAYLTAYASEETIFVSGRRFLEHPFRVLMLWAWMHLRWAFGGDPKRLARGYSDSRASTMTTF